jgi:hypothetical protein
MNTTWCRGVPATLSAWILLVLWGCGGGEAATRPESPAAPGPASQAAAEPEADAEAILMGMAKFLSQAQHFMVNIRGGYDAVQASGQKLEFGYIRKITVSRPDRLRIEVEQSDGDKNLVLFDGKEITVFSTPRNVYAKAPKPGSLDEAITYFIKGLHMRLPLAMLFVSRLPAELDRRTQSLDYVEKTNVLGVPSHHLAGRMDTVDFQVWVAEGDQPLPLRVVLTYKDAEGEPQFRAQFSDWNLSPEITDSMFAFTPPEGAEKIAFLPQLRAVAAPRKEAPDQRGDQK